MFSLRTSTAGLCAIQTARRTFVSTASRAAGKESALHQEGRAEEAEQAKQQQLKEQKEGKGQWKDALASDSESIVKADRDTVDAKKSIKELQKETAQRAEKEKK